MDDDFGTLYVLQNFISNFYKLGLVTQKLIADAVHAQRIFMAVALGVKVKVQVVTRELAVQQLHTTQLNNSVAVFSR